MNFFSPMGKDIVCNELFKFDLKKKLKRNILKAAHFFCFRLNWLHPPLRYIVCIGIYTYLLHREKKDKEEARKGAAMARAK